MGRPEINFVQSSIRSVELNRFIFLIVPGLSALELGSGVDSLVAANVASGCCVFEGSVTKL